MTVASPYAEGGQQQISAQGPGAGKIAFASLEIPGDDPAPWEAAGATWCLTGFDAQPTESEVRAAIG